MQAYNLGDFLALGSIGFLVLISLVNLFTPAKKDVSKPTAINKKTPVKAATTEVQITWKERLSKGMSKSRQTVWGRFESIFKGGVLTPEEVEEVEELLYSADIGPKTVNKLMEALQDKVKKGEITSENFKSFLFDFLKSCMQEVQNSVPQSLFEFTPGSGNTQVVMIVGVNGAGKTTTIGKLATKLTQQGAKVFVGACDTFRAAAVDQLQVWCDRSGATMVRAKEGGDPSGVAFETLEKAKAAGADYCLIDTAGRLHTKANLMEELKKNKRVLKKIDDNAPQHTLLVIDSITGQNAMRQAEEFHKALELTGLIFTKCDGSSKAGNAVSIVQALQVPITYIGVGEGVEDLDVFQLEDYLGALLGHDVRV